MKSGGNFVVVRLISTVSDAWHDQVEIEVMFNHPVRHTIPLANVQSKLSTFQVWRVSPLTAPFRTSGKFDTSGSFTFNFLLLLVLTAPHVAKSRPHLVSPHHLSET
jgi:hypothetical protein